MKKIIVFVAVSLFVLGNTKAISAQEFDGIYDKYQVIYSPSGKYFATGGMVEDRIVLSKKTSPGSGSYSEYYYSDGKLAFALGSNFEFIIGSKLIAVHNNDLTFYEITYKNKKFREKKLGINSVKKLFPEARIIKISQFKNGVMTIEKDPSKKLHLILLNDTKRDFYKYSYTPASVKTTDVTALLEIDVPGKIHKCPKQRIRN